MSEFKQYRSQILDSEVRLNGKSLPACFNMPELRAGFITTSYSCFEYINRNARIVICGITPGMQQATNALLEARKALLNGASDEEAVKAAKEVASFSGPMRRNLVAMLDFVGINGLLGIESCASLFDQHKELVHYTSTLRYPVFVNGDNYSGTPNMLKTPCLLQQVETFLAEEVQALSSDCIYIPLGPKVVEALLHLQGKGLLKPEQIIAGLPHPSGANAERISYFMGNKERNQLSAKTNADSLDNARKAIFTQVAYLRSR